MARFEFDEGVQLVVDRVPGTRNDKCTVHATNDAAAIKGLCWLTEEVAKGLSVNREGGEESVKFQGDVKLVLDRAGEDQEGVCKVEAESPAALIWGLCRLVEETASVTDMTPEEVVCRMAVVLFRK